MKTLSALIVLGAFSFSLAYKGSYMPDDGGYNLTCLKFCVSRILACRSQANCTIQDSKRLNVSNKSLIRICLFRICKKIKRFENMIVFISVLRRLYSHWRVLSRFNTNKLWKQNSKSELYSVYRYTEHQISYILIKRTKSLERSGIVLTVQFIAKPLRAASTTGNSWNLFLAPQSLTDSYNMQMLLAAMDNV